MKQFNFIARFIVLAMLCLSTSVAAYTTPSTITLQGAFTNQQGGLVEGYYDVRVRISDEDYNTTTFAFSQEFTDVIFVNGIFSIVITDLTYEELEDLDDPEFRVAIRGESDTTYSDEVSFPIPASPYAIQAMKAESVVSVDASVVSGTFSTTVNIESDLNVDSGVLYVDSSQNMVGINTTSPEYELDVDGYINATGFLVDGEEVDSLFAWEDNGTTIYYAEGNVGIATENPAYDLDVAGTINAQYYLVNGVEIASYLKANGNWSTNSDGDIYFGENTDSSDGFVGIGTSEPVEALDVSGSIRISRFEATTPEAGTIQFTDDGSDTDFQGYDGTEWQSLIGIQGTGSDGQVVIWSDSDTITGNSRFVWDDDNYLLGIGTATPDARLTIEAENEDYPYVHIVDSDGDSVFYIDDSGVGIGTSSPAYDVQIEGTLDADSFTINGSALSLALSEDSIWIQGNEDKIYYNLGDVGIGTSSPNNSLELSDSDLAAITFDIDDEDLFTIGIVSSNSDAFIISQGSDLDDPVFTFQGEKIGIGTDLPSANLHVSGNTGFVSVGQYGASDSLAESGQGSKLIWYPALSAFRAGYVFSDNWDESNLGDYSVALGNDPIASGIGSVAVGHFAEASGDYATAMGGLQNTADGDYSFAAGHGSNAAHIGSFVWSDHTATSNSFSTSAKNQFLIRANGGVGIGTTDTSEAVLNVSRSDEDEFIFQGIGTDDETKIVFTTSGNVGIGTTEPGDAKLAVIDGLVGIGLTTPTATLHIVEEDEDLLFVVQTESGTENAALLVEQNGNVGIGVSLNYDFDGSYSLVVNGGVLAESFQIDTEDGTILLTPNPGSPWSEPDTLNDFATYYNLGNVGIGTSTPNSLLELSNGNVSGDIPAITFDLDNEDLFTLGVTLNATETDYLFTFNTGGSITTTPTMVISSQSVGIGLDLNTPSANLHVSGNAIIEGTLAVGTDNVGSGYTVDVLGILNATSIYLDGEEFEVPTESPWLTNSPDIYFLTGNVGIGTANPSTALEVNGIISANSMTLSNDVSLSGDIITNTLRLIDQDDETTSGSVYVDDGSLTYVDPDGTTTILSSPLNKGDGTFGNFAYFVDETTLGESDIYWNTDSPVLNITGNMIVNRSLSSNDFVVTSSVSLGGDTPILVSSNIYHLGQDSDVISFTAQYINIDIAEDWGNSSTSVNVIGLDIDMGSDGTAEYLNNAEAIGVYVDMEDITVGSGAKYAAIFNGGNVGIGITNPSTALEVSGTISANNLILTEGLEFTELDVNEDTLVARTIGSGTSTEPRIGIGLTNPDDFDAELYVNGLVSANEIVVDGGLESITVNISDGTDSFFYIDASGNIGIGTDDPDGQLHIQKDLDDSTETDDFISQKIDITIDGAVAGNDFHLNQDIYGMNIVLSSQDDDDLDADAKGINIDMTELDMSDDSTATGLYIDVDGTSGTRYAAIFNGGYVGIGVTTPSAELHVSGDIIANDLILDGSISASEATFNYLTVSEGATFNGVVTINTLYVEGTLTANTLFIDTAFEAPEATITSLNASTASINNLTAGYLTVTGDTTGITAYFSGAVGIGRAAPDSGMAVSGDVVVDSLEVLTSIALQSGTFNINSGDLYLDADSELVGINTETPTAPLHVVTTTGAVFDAADNSTWQTIRVQTTTEGDTIAAGLLLVPDNGDVSDNVGSGIVALRENEDETGSDLLFITDPISGDPDERMRITEEGYFGIGLTNPTSLFTVDGDGYFTGTVTVDTSLTASTITNSDHITINPSGTLFIDGTATLNSDLVLNEGLYIAPSTAPSDTSTFGRVFVDSSDSNLYYLEPSSTTPINLSSAFTGEESRVPYFDEDGNLSDDASLYWIDSSSVFQVGTSNSVSSLEVVSSLNTTVTGNVSLHTITMGFQNRSGQSYTGLNIFKGLDVTLQSEDPDSSTDFGRLAEGEQAIGLVVDMTNLKSKQYLDGSLVTGYKHAASFLGGNVGIGTSAPDAALHLVSEVEGNTVLQIDTVSTSNAFVVDDTSFIGIGTDSPDARLTILGTDSSQTSSAFKIANSSDETLFLVRNDGNIGIGVASPSVSLEVDGTVSASIAIVDSLTASTMNIGEGNFVIDESGNIGIGTAVPSTNINLFKSFTSSPGSDYTSHLIDLSIGEESNSGLDYFTQDITGIDINLASLDTGSLLGDGSTGVTATGISINMSSLELNTDGTKVGLSIDVTGNTGTRYAALLLGGNVGIGVEEPTVALDVDGDIKASSLSLSGSLDADSVTMSVLTVSSTATFNGTLSVDNLVATTVSANNLILDGELTVATGNFTTLNVTSYALVEKIGVNVDSEQTEAFYLSGDGRVTGNLDVTTLTVSTINSLSSDTLWVVANSGIHVSGNMTVSSNIALDDTLFFTPITPPTTSDGNGRLFVSGNGDLVYMEPDSTAYLNISSALSGTETKVPYFDADGYLSDEAELYWDDSTETFTVGGGGNLTAMVLTSNVGTSVDDDYTAQKVYVSLADRSAVNPAASNVFTGLDIQFEGIDPDDPNDFGRLAPNETAIGLRVDVSGVSALYSSAEPEQSDADTTGFKYAALFNGGFVGIGTETPTAALHVVSEADGNDVLRVDTDTNTHVLYVNADSDVGIGTSEPSAKLTVVGDTSDDTEEALRILDSSDNPLMVVRNDGNVGIGTANPTALLHVSGNVPLRIDTNSEDYRLYMNSDGQVGLGTSSPESYFHVVGTSGSSPFRIDSTSSDTYAFYMDSEGDVGIGISDPSFQLEVDGIMMSGTVNATTISSLPSWLSNGTSLARGFLANKDDNNAFFGVKKESSSATVYDATFYWGSDSSDDLTFQRFVDSSSNEDVMTLAGDGDVGLGVAAPDARLHVSGNIPLIAGNDGTPYALVVDSTGYVGVNTRVPSTNLHVAGDMTAESLTVSSSVSISTLNVSEQLTIDRTVVNSGFDIYGELINLEITDDLTQDLIGLEVNLTSQEKGLAVTDYYALYNDGQGYGLKVDVSGLDVNSSTGANGYKYAGAFLGGNVGIGTTQPDEILHVYADTDSTTAEASLAKFSSTDGDLYMKEYGSGVFGYEVFQTGDTDAYYALQLATGDDNIGRVGIGLTDPTYLTTETDDDATLVVNGDTRLGLLYTSTTAESASYGSKLYFSGGPVLTSGKDSDNDDPIWMARYNSAANESELHVSLGDDASSDDKFKVGYTNGGTYYSILDVRMDGNVGLGDARTSAGFDPDAPLHVQASKSGTSLTDHIVILENSGGDDADTLAIVHDVSSSTVDTDSYFVSFWANDGFMGGISGNGDDSGVRYLTIGADYAEYLEKEDHSETIEKGDILGIINGKISKDTSNAQHVMVRSSSASVAGNYPGKDNEDNYALTAFFGQVPVKVIGAVEKGDYIVPSGAGDGTGVAVSADDIAEIDAHLIVGRAWESSTEENQKLILTAVGFNFSMPNLDDKYETLQSLEDEIEEISNEQDELKSLFEDKLEKQNQELEDLLLELEALNAKAY